MTSPTIPVAGSVLDGESVKLLIEWDYLRDNIGQLRRFESLSSQPGRLFVKGAAGHDDLTHFTFIGRSDQDGWIEHDGGENPVPGLTVDVMHHGGALGHNEVSDDLDWSHSHWKADVCDDMDIVAFRPHREVSEGHGSSAGADTHRADGHASSPRVLRDMDGEESINWFAKTGLTPTELFEALSPPVAAEGQVSGQWRPIETAPKDKPIIGWCVHEEDGYEEAKPDGSYRLTLYAAHTEGLSHVSDGAHVIEWGGSFDDSTWEYSGASLPDWWFRFDSEFEVTANPTHWMPLPGPPK